MSVSYDPRIPLFPDDDTTIVTKPRPRRSPRRTVRRAVPGIMQLTLDDMVEMVAQAAESEAIAWEFLLSPDRDMLLAKLLEPIVGVTEHHVADVLGQLEAHFAKTYARPEMPEPTGDPKKDAKSTERKVRSSCKTWWTAQVAKPVANEARRQQLILRGLPGKMTWAKAYASACVGVAPGKVPSIKAVAYALARGNSDKAHPIPTAQVWANARLIVEANKRSINVTGECDVVTTTDADPMDATITDPGLLDLMAEIPEPHRTNLLRLASGEASEDDLPVREAVKFAQALAAKSGEIQQPPSTVATEAA